MTTGVAEALAQGAWLMRADPALAARQAREILALAPANADAWRLLGAALRRLGEAEEAERAELAAISASVTDAALLQAAEALLDNDLTTAERILRPHLHDRPNDVAAIRMMAELAARIGRHQDSETLLRRALVLAPGFGPARANLATILYKQNRPAEAIAELELLPAGEADGAGQQNLRAAAFGRIGAYDEAILIYEQVLARLPDQPKVWMSYGHALKTVGRQADAIAAYRRALALAPTLGEVWWSLANLKTVRFDADDLAAMRAAHARPGLSDDDQLHLDFALGRAEELLGTPAAAFAYYQAGNARRAAMLRYDIDEVADYVAASTALFTPAFFAARTGMGCPATDPIFILGMPRAGSTLVEQILASHSQIEGTMELPDIPALARRLGIGRSGADYPACLAALGADDLAALGAEYLERTRIQRKTGRPFFIDKMPNNWAHVGLIRMILPNAQIIDARRDPRDCCFSNFKQHYARGQGFSYSLETMGRYYALYVMLMAAMRRAMPAPPLLLLHDALLENPEREVHALLDFLGLPFEDSCLRFHENARAVRTASSEQVRRPLNRDGVGQWQPFAEWLGPLETALGPALEGWRD